MKSPRNKTIALDEKEGKRYLKRCINAGKDNPVRKYGLSGLTDEDKIGFTYAVLDHYIRTGEGRCGKILISTIKNPDTSTLQPFEGRITKI